MITLRLRRRTMVLGLAGVGFAGPASAARIEVGSPAPDFVVTTFDLQRQAFADLRGQVVVLNYWATWCAPCRAEMIAMDTFMRRHPKADLKIFAIATEGSVSAGRLKPLAEALSFPLIRRLQGRGYGLIEGAVPTSFVIDRAGIIRHAAAGAFTEASFADLVLPLLAETVPKAPLPV